MIRIDITNEQTRWPVDCEKLRAAVEAVLLGEAFHDGSVSVAVVDDPTIHELNVRYLKHDYPTDVLSFLLDHGPGWLDGEIVVSADTAATTAERFGWSAGEELLLYVVHGALHLAGYDDATPALRAKMRACERDYLSQFGLEARHDEAEVGQESQS